MGKIFKYLKKKFGKGFTFMIVPSSCGGTVRSCSIPFSAALVVFAIIIFNLYIFIGFTTQIWQIYHFKQTIWEKTHRISKLLHEQKEVKPTLQKSYQIAAELNQINAERARLLSTWRSIQQKGGRVSSQTSRGVIVRTRPYALSPVPNPNNEVKTSLSELNNNLKQLSGFLKEESQAQKKLLTELYAYERKLDHTPSIWPVSSFVTSWFGNRYHPVYGSYKNHAGVDLKASYGTKIRSAAEGVVKFSGWQSGYGNTVIINHGYGYETLYGHNSRLVVQVGQAVKKGQLICYSGNSGTSTGPHSHYEVRVGGKPVNPVMFFRN